MSVNVTLQGQLLFPSEYIGAADLKGRDVTLTIAAVKVTELKMQGGKSSRKPVVHFVERPEKKLVLNKTNAKTIAAVTGTGEALQWVGKRITLFPTTTTFGRQTMDCVRIRDRAPAQAESAQATDRQADDGVSIADVGE